MSAIRERFDSHGRTDDLCAFDRLIRGDVARFDAHTTHPDLAVVLDERTDCMLLRQFYHKPTTLEIGSQKTKGRTFVHYTGIKPLITEKKRITPHVSIWFRIFHIGNHELDIQFGQLEYYGQCSIVVDIAPDVCVENGE